MLEASLAGARIETRHGRCIELEVAIGHGSQATVYEGHELPSPDYFDAFGQTGPSRLAVKVLSERTVIGAAGLATEAAYLERLGRNPFVTRLYDWGEAHVVGADAPDVPVLITERADCSMAEVDPATLTLERSLRFITQGGMALQAAHRAGIIHRDVKPANLLLVHQGNSGNLKLGDFGVAINQHQYTQGTEAVGVWAYAAPEMILAGEATPRSDEYSLAAVGFSWINGTLPLDIPPLPSSATDDDLLRAWQRLHQSRDRHLSEPSESDPVQRSLNQVFMGALALQAKKRPAEVLNFCWELQRAYFSGMGRMPITIPLGPWQLN